MACTESALLSIILYTLLVGVMELLGPSDFSPGMRSSMLAHAVLSVGSGLLVVAFAGVDRARDILSQGAQAAAVAQSADGGDDGSDKVLQWIVQRRARGLNMLGVANACCSCTLGVFLLYLCEYMQAVSGWGLDDTLVGRKSVNPLRNAAVYNSSQRLDWIQASAGASGWVLLQTAEAGLGSNETAAVYAVADRAALPVIGSLFAGAVLGYLLLGLLLTLYTSLSATPEGEFSYLVLEPRGLTVTNGILVFGSLGTVEHHFATCSNDVAGSSTLFAIFCLLACFFDEIPELVEWLVAYAKKRKKREGGGKKKEKKSRDKKGSSDDEDEGDEPSKDALRDNRDDAKRTKSGPVGMILSAVRCLMLLIMCWTPPLAIFIMKEGDSGGSSHVPYVVVTASIIASVVSTFTAVLDVFLFSTGGSFSSALQTGYAMLLRRSKREGEEGTGERGGNSGSSGMQEEGGDGESAAEQPAAQEFSMKGFPGADEDAEGKKDNGAKRSDESADSSFGGQEGGSGKSLGAMYSLVNPRDLYAGAGVPVGAVPGSSGSSGSSIGKALARRPALQPQQLQARLKDNDRKWHVA